jgi:hypothetical protein
MRHLVTEPQSRPVSQVRRCRRSMQPSPHPADAMTPNRRALAEVACVALDTDPTSRYASKYRLIDRGAVCCRVDGRELSTFQRCIDPKWPKPPDVHQGHGITIAWSRVNPRSSMSSHCSASPCHSRHSSLGQYRTIRPQGRSLHDAP